MCLIRTLFRKNPSARQLRVSAGLDNRAKFTFHCFNGFFVRLCAIREVSVLREAREVKRDRTWCTRCQMSRLPCLICKQCPSTKMKFLIDSTREFSSKSFITSTSRYNLHKKCRTSEQVNFVYTLMFLC